MPAPLLVAAVIGSGATTSVITGMALDKLTGHKTTERDIVQYAALGAIPGAGYAGAVFKGAKRAKTNKRIFETYTKAGRYGEYLNPAFSRSMVVRFESKAQAKLELMADTVLFGGGLLSGVVAYDVGVNYVLDKVYKKDSRGRGISLTSKLMTPRHNDTTLSNRGGDPSQSKRRVATARGRARRQTSYCKLHKKYDFCEYYKK